MSALPTTKPFPQALEAQFRAARLRSLAEINTTTYWLVALLVMIFSWWDWYVDPVNWGRALAIRALGATVILATGLIQRFTRRVDWAARISKVRFAAAVIAVAGALAVLDRGYLVGVAGLVSVMLAGPYIALDRRDLLVMNAGPLAATGLIMWASGLDRFEVVNATIFIALAIAVSLMLARVFEATNRRAFALEQQLTSEARTDALTGLRNRRAMEEIAGSEVKRGARTGAPLSVIIGDIDHFKQINDRHGHDVGDQVIRRVADVLRGVARDTDALGRWGGEEFLVILPDTDQAAASVLAERMRSAIAHAKMPLDGMRTTMSLGVAGLLPGGSDPARWQEAVRRADNAMYEAKEAGRNRVINAEGHRNAV